VAAELGLLLAGAQVPDPHRNPATGELITVPPDDGKETDETGAN
jgi:hypothetical protein